MQSRTLFISFILVSLSACNSIPTHQSKNKITPAGEKVVETRIVEEETVIEIAASADSDTPELKQQPSPVIVSYGDIWKRIGDNLVLNRNLQQTKVKSKLSWFSRNQAYLDRVSDRAQPYIYFIVEQLEKRQMPLDLALLPIVESAYHPFAYSPSHASGIWQFIPSTGKHYGLKQNWWYDGRRDIVASTRAALDYLQKLHVEFNGDWLLALAAYNSGERNVARAIARNKRAGKKTDFWSLRLPRETRNYVPSLLAIAELVANPQKHQVKWRPIDNQPYLAQISTQEQLDLAIVAKLAELSIEEVYTLNPGFNRWATDPAGPHQIMVPLDKKELFEQGLSGLTASDKVSWKRHIIKQGETLGQIAEDYHISLATLKKTNSLRSNLIRTGHSLLIPSSQKPLQHYTLSMDSRRYRGLTRSGNGKKYTYRVRKGDTLWDIGRQYGVSIKQLCAWNNISSRSFLRPGQKLNLWFSSAGQKPKLTPVNISKVIPNKYTVKRGDSLWLIAQRFGVTVKQLEQWNNLSKQKYLQPGQNLKLYAEPAKGA